MADDGTVIDPPSSGGRKPKAPSLLDAVLPVVVLIGLIALTIVLFGVPILDWYRGLGR